MENYLKNLDNIASSKDDKFMLCFILEKYIIEDMLVDYIDYSDKERYEEIKSDLKYMFRFSKKSLRRLEDLIIEENEHGFIYDLE